MNDRRLSRGGETRGAVIKILDRHNEKNNKKTDEKGIITVIFRRILPKICK